MGDNGVRAGLGAGLVSALLRGWNLVYSPLSRISRDVGVVKTGALARCFMIHTVLLCMQLFGEIVDVRNEA